MITFKVGEFGVVLSRKIVLGIFMTFLLIAIIFVKLQMPTHHHTGPIIPIYETWNNFLKECGREAFDVEDSLQFKERMTFCDVKYREKTVINWKGKH